MEARGNVTEYQAFALDSANTAVVDSCDVSTAVGAPASEHFIRLGPMSAHSSYHVVVTAHTAAGCNSSLAYNSVFILAQKQSLHCVCFIICICKYMTLISRQVLTL